MAKNDQIEITCKRAGYRRAGVAHPKGAVVYPADQFTKAQIEAFMADPRLTVRNVVPEKTAKSGDGSGAGDGGGDGDNSGGGDAWPPSAEQLTVMKHDDLGALLTAKGVDPTPLKSKAERRAAIEELIAKEKTSS